VNGFNLNQCLVNVKSFTVVNANLRPREFHLKALKHVIKDIDIVTVREIPKAVLRLGQTVPLMVLTQEAKKCGYP